jgi:hypothetical protein
LISHLYGLIWWFKGKPGRFFTSNCFFCNMRLIYFLLAVGVGLVFYMSWEPDPHLGTLWFIPKWLAKWTDKRANGNIRTAIPFVFLGLIGGLLPARSSSQFVGWLITWLILIGVVILAEVGQLLLPKRFFSWADIGWGALGAFAGLVVAVVVVSLRKLDKA